MPKAKISHKPASSSSTNVSRTPVKVSNSGTPLWYKIVMFGLMILGLLWLVVNYIAGEHISFMADLHAWNYLIGFGLFVAGLLMTMGWK